MNSFESQYSALAGMIKELNMIYANMSQISQFQDVLEEVLLRLCEIKRAFKKERESASGLLNPSYIKTLRNSRAAKIVAEVNEIEEKIDWLIQQKTHFSKPDYKKRPEPPASNPSIQETTEASVLEEEFQPEIIHTIHNDEEINDLVKDFEALHEMNKEIATLVEKNGVDLVQIEKEAEKTSENVSQVKTDLKKASLQVSEGRRRKFFGYLTTIGGTLGIFGGQIGVAIGLAAGGAVGKLMGDAFTKSSDKKVNQL